MTNPVTLPRAVVEHVLTAWTQGCPPDCKDGMTDSGGVHPWGEAALIQCPACRAVEALRAALEQPQNHVPDIGNMLPAGWKMVPVEPTKSMVESGLYMMNNSASFLKREMAVEIFQAMLAAVPQCSYH